VATVSDIREKVKLVLIEARTWARMRSRQPREPPVVNICYEDAVACAKWANKLPPEAEWEIAAHGGLDHKPYTWGNEFSPDGPPIANTGRASSPHLNTREEGFLDTTNSHFLSRPGGS
jgi:formylglycine-generating enzyme required for sulfatase activity